MRLIFQAVWIPLAVTKFKDDVDRSAISERNCRITTELEQAVPRTPGKLKDTVIMAPEGASYLGVSFDKELGVSFNKEVKGTCG